MTGLLLFLDEEGVPARWIEAGDAGARARGTGMPEAAGAAVVLVPPPAQVALHRLELPLGLTAAQAAAAARLQLASSSAAPPGDLHVAVGREEKGARWVGVASMERMRAWLAAAPGADPVAMVPAPLLLPEPAQGFLRHGTLFRGGAAAFAAEESLAKLLTQGAPVADLQDAEAEEALTTGAFEPLLDLRQGVFARRRQWRGDPLIIRRLVLTAAGIGLVSLAIQLVDITRHSFRADRIEQETARLLGSAPPERLAAAQAGDGYSAMAGALFDAVLASPNVELAGLGYDGGVLRARLAADVAEELQTVFDRLATAGYAVEVAARAAGGTPSAEIAVRAR